MTTTHSAKIFRSLCFLIILLMNITLASAKEPYVASAQTPPQEICTAQSEFPWQEWIEDVQIGTLENYDSGKFRNYATAGYSDYTDLVSAPIDRSNPVEYVLNTGFSGVNPGDYWTVYIDYNQNNIFDLPEERVITNKGIARTGTFTIPNDALNGTTLCRVILSKNTYSDPCDHPAFGEVEDYLITIGEIIPPVELPDLTVSALTVTDQVVQNGIIDYAIKISNIGQAPAQNFKFGVFVSTDDLLDPNDQLIEVIDIDNLDPFSIQDIESTLDLNGGPAGEYFIFFKVDKEEIIEESQETNNTIRRNLEIIENTGNLIDLELSMTATISDPARFSRTRVMLTLTNNSPNQATNIAAELFLTPNIDDFVFAGDGAVALTGGGTFSVVSGAWTIPSLAGGAIATASFDLFTLSDDFSPCAQVRDVDQEDVDSTPGNGQCPNAVEDDEANLSEGPPTPPTIDFALESLDFPSSGFTNDGLEGVITYSRLGNLVESLTILGSIYLSEDEQLDADDIVVGPANLSTGIPVTNNTEMVNFDLEGIEPGDYRIFVVLDEPNDVEEFNESNNILSIPFTVLEMVPECSQIIGGDEILCSENIGELTRLYIREGNEFYTTDLDQDANVVASGAASPLVYDSTLIEENVLIHKLADGTITFSGVLPADALNYIPNPTAATRLTTGEYLIAGVLEIGQAPSVVETRVLKLDANLTTILDQNTIATNDLYPSNLNDQVFALYPLAGGRASIVYTIYSVGVTDFSNIQVKELDPNLNAGPGTNFSQTILNSITETPCGDLLFNTTLFNISQRGNTIATQKIRVAKDGLTVYTFSSRGVNRTDRFEPREFSIFRQNQEPEFILGTSFPEENPPAETIASFPQTNGDTTQVTFPYFEYNYGTRNGATGILYGNLNGQITAVTNDCGNTDGVDLEVSLEVSNESPTIFSKIFYQVTVQNLGNEEATNVSIDFDYGAQETPKRLAFVSSTDPEYSGWRGIWEVGTLAPGSAKTFSLEVFVLSAAGPSTTLTASLNMLDQEDLNSANNESSATINLGASLSEAITQETIITEGPRLSINQLFPIPAQEKVTIVIESKEIIENTSLQLFDTFGKMMYETSLSINPGINFVEIPISELQEGIYLAILPDGSYQNLVKRFVKIR